MEGSLTGPRGQVGCTLIGPCRPLMMGFCLGRGALDALGWPCSLEAMVAAAVVGNGREGWRPGTTSRLLWGRVGAWAGRWGHRDRVQGMLVEVQARSCVGALGWRERGRSLGFDPGNTSAGPGVGIPSFHVPRFGREVLGRAWQFPGICGRGPCPCGVGLGM